MKFVLVVIKVGLILLGIKLPIKKNILLGIKLGLILDGIKLELVLVGSKVGLVFVRVKLGLVN